MKRKFKEPEVELIVFASEDVITTSAVDENEGGSEE